MKISTIPSAMTEGNRAISGQKAKGRMAAPGPLVYACAGCNGCEHKSKYEKRPKIRVTKRKR